MSQGKQAEAYEIIQKMNRINNGKDSKFDKFVIYEESESIEYRQLISQTKTSRFPILSAIWLQTSPLFKSPHLFSTILICVIQFCIFLPAGCMVFGAVILNKMSTNLHDFINQRAMMCDVINMELDQYNDTISVKNEDVCNYLDLIVIAIAYVYIS